MPLDRADPYRPYQPYTPPKYSLPQDYGQTYGQTGPQALPSPYEPPSYPQRPYAEQAPMVYRPPVDPRQLAYQQSLYDAQKSRVAAGLLAIFLGSLGIHNFYLGRTGVAVAQLLITVLTLGLGAAVVSVWALVEGILILTRSPSFLTDARGIPLRD